MSTAEPLARITSIKVKLAALVGVSVVVALVFFVAGDHAGIPSWLTVPATIAAALGASWWLARGMTAPLREMTAATVRMAAGDYGLRVGARSGDEVGVLARSFNTMAADLGAADEQRRELVATVSHELRTPLAAQRAVLENLADGVTAPDPDVLLAALGQAERLSRLVDDLLDLSRLDAGTTSLALGDVGVRELLASCVREAALTSRPVSYAVDVAPEDLTVRADAARLAQVVTNLLDNATRHSPPHGTVRLRATVDRSLTPARWTLEVADEGDGIPAEHRDRVFERYGGGGDDRTGGTGLGLSIARWAARLHGGTIVAVDPPSGEPGARIRLTLPLHPSSAADHTPSDTGHAEEAPMTSVPTDPVAVDPVAADRGRTVLDDLFGSLWPEPALRPQPALLLGSLAIGAF
ncbi:HAMP domain-containing sensor histidine kinase, partial [Nostocoides japonicum]|uniref:HAMP domain-containing sensor histidine kinase n=1 Tax=Nostocoides japonicum TaxID=99481 RepID=UPI0012FCDC99